MLEQSFVVVLMRTGGQWVGHSRDFPHIQIKGRSAESTYVETASAVRREIHRLWSAGQPLPSLRSYADVRIDDAFARERGIQWPRAIVRMAALPEQMATISNPPPASAAAEIQPLTRAG